MARIRSRLTHPPISEALIDIRIAGVEPTHDALTALRKSLESRYPRFEEQRAFEATLAPSKGTVESKDQGFVGYFLYSEDNKTVVQLKTSGFTLNRLTPYTGGDVLVEEALRVWEMYANVVRPTAVTRLAIRYINKLQLPLREGDDLHRFLHAPPIVPEGLDNRVSDFLTRTVVHDAQEDITTIVMQALTLAADGPVPFVLDLDVFKLETLPIESPVLAKQLLALRTAAKRAFFGSLTEETVNLYA
jgi:uncharacterized protein (TIGR04255 family)